MDWVLLILLVPAVLVPIVLLFGFSGCSSFTAADPDPVAPPLPPTLLHSELTKNRDGIILTWQNQDGNTVNSYIERINESAPGVFPTPLTTSSPAAIFADSVGNGLSEGATFKYTVQSNLSDGSRTDPSNESRTTMPPAPPTDLVATGVELEVIKLTWKNGSKHATRFRVYHRPPGGVFAPIGDATDLLFSHKDLLDSSTHEYQVTAIVDGFNASVSKKVESIPSGIAVGKTKSWETAYFRALTPPVALPYAGNCVVQRIESALLLKSGEFVRVTLRGLIAAETRLAAVTLSNAVPVGSVKGWDSLTVPENLRFAGLLNVAISNGKSVTSEKLKFKITAGSGPDLAIAMDVATNSQNLCGGSFAGTRHYFRAATVEATTQVRSAGYTTPLNQVCCIEKIEVA